MTIIAWDEKYRTGYLDVDKQHQELFRMVNELHEAIVAGKGKELMIKTLDGLAKYVVTHFAVEEKLMIEKKYPGFAEHKAKHDKLKVDAVDMIEKYKSGKLALSITVSRFLGDWIQTHILVEDLKMIRFVQSVK